jgi:hypothetical protein
MERAGKILVGTGGGFGSTVSLSATSNSRLESGVFLPWLEGGPQGEKQPGTDLRHLGLAGPLPQLFGRGQLNTSAEDLHGLFDLTDRGHGGGEPEVTVPGVAPQGISGAGRG